MTYAILIILFIVVAIILLSSVIKINKIVFKHRNEVFSTKTENGKVYRKQILMQFIYIVLSLLGYFLIALLVFYLTGKEFKIYY
jgi:uncharacterized membrane protein YbhN (UPF0104 family)